MRYYGWLHPAAKKRLHRVQNLTSARIVMSAPEPAADEDNRAPQPICKHCGGTEFHIVDKLKPRRFIHLSASSIGTADQALAPPEGQPAMSQPNPP